MPIRALLQAAMVLTLARGLVAAGPVADRMERAEKAAALARRIAPRVEEIRGRKFKRPVSVEVVDAETARNHFVQRISKTWPEERLRLDQRIYVHLGLLPEETDVLSSLLDILSEQAWGYYDPERDTFFVLEDVPQHTAPVLMAHELTHALDDQHYGLDALIEATRDDEDRAAALSAVIEGSGTAVMTVFMLEEIRAGRMEEDVFDRINASEAGQADALRAAPPFLRRGLMAPYVLGVRFVLRGDPRRLSRGRFDPRDLDRAFEQPPLSSEQILHPEKYWDQSKADPPRPVRLPDLSAGLGEGWSLVAEGRLGELVLAQLAGSEGPAFPSPDPYPPSLWTNAAARGLAGDRYSHYVNGGHSLTLLGTLWDGPDEAEEFLESLTPLAGRYDLLRGSWVFLVAGDVRGSLAEALVAQALAAVGPAAAP